jgi:predicted Zn-ribbon and HTH transcriptional regulator
MDDLREKLAELEYNVWGRSFAAEPPYAKLPHDRKQVYRKHANRILATIHEHRKEEAWDELRENYKELEERNKEQLVKRWRGACPTCGEVTESSGNSITPFCPECRKGVVA